MLFEDSTEYRFNGEELVADDREGLYVAGRYIQRFIGHFVIGDAERR